jgi:hypothetical protein
VLYGDRSARDRIEFSPVGALLATHFSFATSFPWTKASTRRVMTNEILPGMVRAFPNHHVPPLRLPILVLRRDYNDQKGAFPRTVTTTVYSYQSLIHNTTD